MKLSDLDNSIECYKNNCGKNPSEIRVNIKNYLDLARETNNTYNLSDNEILLDGFIYYMGIKITWGVEI